MPVELDWDGTTDDGYSIAKPGVYLAEVDRVEFKRTQGGQRSLRVQLREASTREQLCMDILMLEGGGRGIGMAKLRQLGVPEGTKELDPLSLVGRRVKIAIKHDVYEGKKTTKVDISYDGFKCGYLAVEVGDEDGVPPPAGATPF